MQPLIMSMQEIVIKLRSTTRSLNVHIFSNTSIMPPLMCDAVASIDYIQAHVTYDKNTEYHYLTNMNNLEQFEYNREDGCFA